MNDAALESTLFEQDRLPFRITAEEVHDLPYPDEPSETTEIEEEDETGISEAETAFIVRMDEEEGDPDEDEDLEVDVPILVEEDIAMSACSLVIDMRRPRPCAPWPAPRPHELPPIYDQRNLLAA